MVKTPNHATINVYPQLENEIQPRLKEIIRIKDYSIIKVCKRETMS